MMTRKYDLEDLTPEIKTKLSELGLLLQDHLVADFVMITFPTLHDSVQGFRIDIEVAE